MSALLNIIKLFCEDRNNAEAYIGYITELTNLEKEHKVLFELINHYYETTEASNISKDELRDYYTLKYPKSRNHDMYMLLIDQAFNREISNEIIKTQIDQILEQHYAAKIVNKLLPVLDQEQFGILNTVQSDVEQYIDRLNYPPPGTLLPTPCDISIQDLVKNEIENEGVPWFLSKMTDLIGGAKRKTTGLIYAYVDSGKTSFVMASCAHFAQYFAGTDTNILYLGNEESASRIRVRFVQALLKWTRSDIQNKWEEATIIARDRGLNNVLIFENITVGQQIEKLVRKYRPYLIYVDQAHKIKIPGAGKLSGVDYLEALFIWFRNFSTTYNLSFVGTTQATGKAEDSKYLNLSDIYGSRTGIQASLDWAMGIGRLVDDIDPSLRYVNFPKNKLNDGDVGKFPLYFDKYKCEWKEV